MAARGEVNIYLLVAQGVVTLICGFLLFQQSIEFGRKERVEERIDKLEIFASGGFPFDPETERNIEGRIHAMELFMNKGDRYTLERGLILENRVTIIERDIGHLWETHHPNERRSNNSPDDSFASHKDWTWLPNAYNQGTLILQGP
jgi:hypothetical protein